MSKQAREDTAGDDGKGQAFFQCVIQGRLCGLVWVAGQHEREAAAEAAAPSGAAPQLRPKQLLYLSIGAGGAVPMQQGGRRVRELDTQQRAAT